MEYIVYGIWFLCGYLCHNMRDYLHTQRMARHFARLPDDEKQRILDNFNNVMKKEK